VVVSYPSGNR